MRQTMGIVAAVLVFVAFVCVVDSAKATITDVNILPEEPTVEDVITIAVSGWEGSGGVLITDSDLRMEGTSLELDIFLDVGFFQMITPWSHSEIIGTLPADSYNLTVNAYYSVAYTGTDTYSTSFAVVPEPASILLLLMGVVGVREGHCRNNVNFRTSRDIQEEGA